MKNLNPISEAVKTLQPVKVLVDLIASHPDLVRQADQDGFLPLHFSAACGAPLEVVNELVKSRSETLRVKTSEGSLPLHLAAKNSSPEVIDFLADAWEQALKEEDNNGFLPLHVAAAQAHLTAVQVLCKKYRAALWIPTKAGQLPIDVARRANNVEVAAWLETLPRPDYPRRSVVSPTVDNTVAASSQGVTGPRECDRGKVVRSNNTEACHGTDQVLPFKKQRRPSPTLVSLQLIDRSSMERKRTKVGEAIRKSSQQLRNDGKITGASSPKRFWTTEQQYVCFIRNKHPTLPVFAVAVVRRDEKDSLQQLRESRRNNEANVMYTGRPSCKTIMPGGEFRLSVMGKMARVYLLFPTSDRKHAIYYMSEGVDLNVKTCNLVVHDAEYLEELPVVEVVLNADFSVTLQTP
jgi:hypothetical protein